MSKKKPFYKSYTIWAAVLPMVLELINLMLVSPIIPVQYQGHLTFVSGVLVIIARFTSTGSQVTITKKVEDNANNS